MESITQLLSQVQNGNGDAGVWDRIYTLLYHDLHRIAGSLIRQQRRTSRSPTSLISESWLRLAGAKLTLESRAHLISLVVRAMRFTLIDEVRQSLGEKHGKGVLIVNIDEVEIESQEMNPERLLMLDQALNDLAEVDERLVRVVELRFFGGMLEEDIAQLLQVTRRTVRRDWRKARAFLALRLGDYGSVDQANDA